MIFSKSFGYAVRSILYITIFGHENRRIQSGEIAGRLSIPKYFLGKVMKELVKKKIIDSAKGPTGGFSVNGQTLSTSLIQLFAITDGMEPFDACALGLKYCDAEKPCPLHDRIIERKNDLYQMLSSTTIGDLFQSGKENFLKGIAVPGHISKIMEQDDFNQ
jgi:Rrf2 family protein